MKTLREITVLSRHVTLAEAVAESGIDLSYNQSEAERLIRRTDKNVKEAFVTPEGVFYLYQADILLFNKFSPFCGILDDGAFHQCFVLTSKILIDSAEIGTNVKARKEIAKQGWTVTKNQ